MMDSFSIHSILDKSLFQPAFELSKRQRKSFRSSIVHLAYQLVANAQGFVPTDSQKSVLSFFAKVIEGLHMGSLIIDDIQDNSSQRRQGPCVHVMFGVPLAINAGNCNSE